MCKIIPFSTKDVLNISKSNSTPFYVYDEGAIRRNIQQFLRHFSWTPKGFKNFFAVKALPNPEILRVVMSEGMGLDCSSYAELVLAERVGARGDEIMFTSNNTPYEDMQKAVELGAQINLDDITHIPFLADNFGMPEFICFRYNPGPLKKGNHIIGNPVEAKYGLTREQIFEAYSESQKRGAKRFGLHTMIASNERNAEYFIETATLLFDLIVEIHKKTGVAIEFVNLGGGIGIPYEPSHEPVDVQKISKGIKEAYDAIIVSEGLDPIRIVMENGRYITGPFGYLVSRVIHEKNTYKDYIGIDASMADLMRPGMYTAYHHISVLGKEQESADHVYDIVGSLCENNDKFAIDRKLPDIDMGDYVVIHDAGAHGHAMGFNYNGKLRHAEFLKTSDGEFVLIRRAETLEDYFRTIIWR